jgi:hypothetical protein
MRRIVSLGIVFSWALGAPAAWSKTTRRGATAKPAAPAVTKPTVESAKKPAAAAAPRALADADIEAAIDAAFVQWSTGWGIDQYRLRSAHLLMKENRDGVLKVTGRFSFLRLGRMLTIPFSALLGGQNGRILVAGLCYQDTTTGMADCYGSARDTPAPNEPEGRGQKDGDDDESLRDKQDREFRQRLRDREQEQAREYKEREEARQRARADEETARWYQAQRFTKGFVRSAEGEQGPLGGAIAGLMVARMNKLTYDACVASLVF